MSNNENFGIGMVFGFVLGSLVNIITYAMTDEPSKEPPMQAHCQIYQSNLVKYNARSFECDNGARFMRYIVEEQNK